jgi:nucleoside-diphosphate-sugar epimerase
MKVFVTGASGFVGSAVVAELLQAGHQVLGLARSDASAQSLAAAGADVQRGSLTDAAGLRAGAAAADGVIHTAFIHDFSRREDAARIDLEAITTIGEELAGSQRPFVVTSGTGARADGGVVSEDVPLSERTPTHRSPADAAALGLASRGVRSSLLRLPQVHGHGDHAFVPWLIHVARERGVSAYIGDGANRWPAVHRLDAARLYRLALEAAPAGATLHAVADEGVPARAIAGAIGRGLGVPERSIAPEEAAEHFAGWIGEVFAWDVPASAELTRARFDWTPTGPGLLEDLAEAHYFAPAKRAA